MPRGAETDTVPEVIKPVGEVVLDANFGNGQDTVIYVVPNLEKDGKGFFIEAELKDQTLSYRMVQDLKDLLAVVTDETGVIERFLNEYEHHKVQYELIDKDEVEFR